MESKVKKTDYINLIKKAQGGPSESARMQQRTKEWTGSQQPQSQPQQPKQPEVKIKQRNDGTFEKLILFPDQNKVRHILFDKNKKLIKDWTSETQMAMASYRNEIIRLANKIRSHSVN